MGAGPGTAPRSGIGDASSTGVVSSSSSNSMGTVLGTAPRSGTGNVLSAGTTSSSTTPMVVDSATSQKRKSDGDDDERFRDVPDTTTPAHIAAGSVDPAATTTPLTVENDMDLNYLVKFYKLPTCDCSRDEDFPLLISDITPVFHLSPSDPATPEETEDDHRITGDFFDDPVPDTTYVTDKFPDLMRATDPRVGGPTDKETIDRTPRPNDLVFHDTGGEDVLDDLTGAWLPANLVRQAKLEELSEMYRRGVWTETPKTMCVSRIGSQPITVRWVITNKGDAKTPIVRARLVARHIAARYGGKDVLHELFAAMPPFEMIKFLLLRAV